MILNISVSPVKKLAAELLNGRQVTLGDQICQIFGTKVQFYAHSSTKVVMRIGLGPNGRSDFMRKLVSPMSPG